MAKFHGFIGYVETVETAPGVHTEQATEREYRGDILRQAFRVDQGDKINPDFVANNRISIIADAFALGHLSHIRYVVWDDVAWSVKSFEINRPRVILSIGGLYNG